MRSIPRVVLLLLSTSSFFLYNAHAQQPPNSNQPSASSNPPPSPPPPTPAESGSFVGSGSNNPPPPASVTSLNSILPSSNGTSPPSNQTSPTPAPSAPANGTNINPVIGLPTSTSVPNTAQAAYASFVTPSAPVSSMLPLYPIDGNVTFVWGYDTNIKVQPVSLTLCAVLPTNTQYTYTITQMPGTQTSAVWDTGPFRTADPPLIMGEYRIMLFDQRGPTAIPSPGWLMPLTRLTIGLYIPQSYTAYTNPSTCATCYFENNFPKDSLNAMAVTFGVSLLTTAGFLWFAL